MEFNYGIGMGNAEHDAAAQRLFADLAAENARLRQLVGELLLKNQRLRDAGVMEDFLPVVVRPLD